MDKVSIIIRNKSESDYIGFALQSCLDFFDEPQIIIIDNDSDEESKEVIGMFSFADIDIVGMDNYSPGKALNIGVQKTKYENILIMSAHTQIIEMDVEYVLENLQQYVAVFGQQIPIYKGKKVTKRYVWSHFIDKEVVNMFSKLEARQFMHNAFCFYRKNELVKKPFREDLFGKEERYWADTIVYENKEYLYTPKMKCNHYWTPEGATWKGLG